MKITATDFYYNGVHSSDFNVTKISMNTGLVEGEMMHTSNISTELLKNQYKARLVDIDKEPLEFKVALYFDGNLDEAHMKQVRKWLRQENFKPLIFDDSNNDYVFYAIADGAMPLKHNAVDSGYVEFTFKTNSPYKFSNLKTVSGTSTATESTVTINNNGDMPALPKIQITMATPAPALVEISTPRPEDAMLNKLIITNNLSSEVVVIDSDSEFIQTSSTLRHVYNDHNGVYLFLKSGINTLKFKGDFSYIITYQEVYY